MTGLEIENFYKLDEKKYILKKNESFIKYYNEKEKEGFHPIININQMQNLMSEIVAFFEFKYPDIMLEKNSYSYTKEDDYDNCKRISKMLGMEQLKYRLYHDYVQFLECNYGGYINLKKNSGYIGHVLIFLDAYGFINKNDIDAISEEGFLKDIDGIERIEDLLGRFKAVENDVDYSEVEHHVYYHKNNIAIRNKVLKLIPLYMIYSKNTLPEYGYIRAKSFIKMFNREYGLDLDSKEIDKIMNIDYSQSIKTIKKEDMPTRIEESPLESASHIWPKVKMKIKSLK